MRALVKAESAPGLWLQDVPKPAPGPGEVLIKVHMASICGTDMHIWKWDDWAQKTVPVPLVVGHEYVGVVEAVGADVVEVKSGDRVSGEGHPIIPVMLGDAVLAQEFAARMMARGVYVTAFSFPVVPRGQARIRTQMSAAHETADIDRAVEAFIAVGRELEVVA